MNGYERSSSARTRGGWRSLGVPNPTSDLLAVVTLDADAVLWTQDRRLHSVVVSLGIALRDAVNRVNVIFESAGTLVGSTSVATQTP
jgi:hypothetical protein